MPGGVEEDRMCEIWIHRYIRQWQGWVYPFIKTACTGCSKSDDSSRGEGYFSLFTQQRSFKRRCNIGVWRVAISFLSLDTQGENLGGLPHMWRNLPHGKALWTSAKTITKTADLRSKSNGLWNSSDWCGIKFKFNQSIKSIKFPLKMHYQRNMQSSLVRTRPIPFELGPSSLPHGHGRKKISRIGIRQRWQVHTRSM